jgi:hypothetical protein
MEKPVTEQVVSEKALANTYDNGWTTVKQYRAALDFRDDQPDLAQAEIARRVERSPSTVRAWLVEKHRPDPIQALEVAEERGWLRSDPESEVFRVINALTAWIFAGGTINHRTFEPRFSAGDLLELATLNHLLEIVDLPYWIRQKESEQGLEIVTQSGASIFGRLLSTIGAPIGGKATKSELTLPECLHTAGVHLRRDFARIYLLTRGVRIGNTERYRIGEVRTSEYLRELQTLLSSATETQIKRASQGRLIVPPMAVKTLCDGTPNRAALAAQVAHGAPIPPTERAVMMAYRRGESPSGKRYLNAYRATTADDGADRQAIAKEYGLSPATVYNWQHGTTPDLLTAVEEIHDRGWMTSTMSEPACTLTAFSAWICAFGTLRRTSYPVFRVSSEAQRVWFQTLINRADLSFTTRLEDTDRTTEFHVTSDAGRLGRVLRAIGVPKANQEFEQLAPPYLWYNIDAAAAYIATWVLHHGRVDDDILHIGSAQGASECVLRTLADLAREQLNWNIKTNAEGEVQVSYERARSSLSNVLPASVITEFEDSMGV